MRVEIHGHQMDVTQALHDYVIGKFERLERHFERDADIRVQIGQEKPDFKAEATAAIAGHSLHTEAVAHDMYVAIDQLVDKLDRLLLKQKDKQVDHHRGESVARSARFAD